MTDLPRSAVNDAATYFDSWMKFRQRVRSVHGGRASPSYPVEQITAAASRIARVSLETPLR